MVLRLLCALSVVIRNEESITPLLSEDVRYINAIMDVFKKYQKQPQILKQALIVLRQLLFTRKSAKALQDSYPDLTEIFKLLLLSPTIDYTICTQVMFCKLSVDCFGSKAVKANLEKEVDDRKLAVYFKKFKQNPDNTALVKVIEKLSKHTGSRADEEFVKDLVRIGQRFLLAGAKVDIDCQDCFGEDDLQDYAAALAATRKQHALLSSNGPGGRFLVRAYTSEVAI